MYVGNWNGRLGPFNLATVPPDRGARDWWLVADIGPFVLTLTNPAAYATTYPGCDINSADINGDGFVTVADIGGFVGMLAP